MTENEQVYKVVISPKAAKMLSEHARFLAQLDERFGRKLIQDFQREATSLRQLPYRTPVLRSEVIAQGKYRVLVFNKWYLILYQIKADTVHIDYVVDGRQDYEWLLY